MVLRINMAMHGRQIEIHFVFQAAAISSAERASQTGIYSRPVCCIMRMRVAGPSDRHRRRNLPVSCSRGYLTAAAAALSFRENRSAARQGNDGNRSSNAFRICSVNGVKMHDIQKMFSFIGVLVFLPRRLRPLAIRWRSVTENSIRAATGNCCWALLSGAMLLQICAPLCLSVTITLGDLFFVSIIRIRLAEVYVRM